MIGGSEMPVPEYLDGAGMYSLATELFPICRSITGDGVRRTLRRLGEIVPLRITEIPTGTSVLDWTVPREWNIREAWIASTDGRRIVDLAQSSLHVVNYSRPVRGRFDRATLDEHLHSLPDHPEWIPYRTSYYNDTWGFCLTDRVRRSMTDAEYDVLIDSTLEDGHLTYGECIVPGASAHEIVLSAHVCHPSLANDNLSGLVVLTALAQRLSRTPRRFTYRVIFAPGTIGAICWLAGNDDAVARLKNGLVVSCLGDQGRFTYKQSRQGRAEIDRVFALMSQRIPDSCSVRPFSPDGYDERQFCSPGFNLPVGRLTRTPNAEYPEYHTSADNLDLIRPSALADALEFLMEALDVIEGNRTYVNVLPRGEPQLGRRGLYRSLGGVADPGQMQMALLWVLNLSDGGHDLIAIAERSGLPFHVLRQAAQLLNERELLRDVTDVAQ